MSVIKKFEDQLSPISFEFTDEKAILQIEKYEIETEKKDATIASLQNEVRQLELQLRETTDVLLKRDQSIKNNYKSSLLEFEELLRKKQDIIDLMYDENLALGAQLEDAIRNKTNIELGSQETLSLLHQSKNEVADLERDVNYWKMESLRNQNLLGESKSELAHISQKLERSHLDIIDYKRVIQSFVIFLCQHIDANGLSIDSFIDLEQKAKTGMTKLNKKIQHLKEDAERNSFKVAELEKLLEESKNKEKKALTEIYDLKVQLI